MALPQSNESATYFALPPADTASSDGGDEDEPALALLMRVRLDSGVHELAVARGADAATLAARFGREHALRPQQVYLLGVAIAQHLQLAEQYQADADADASATHSAAHSQQSTARRNEDQQQQQQHAQLDATSVASTQATPERERHGQQQQQQPQPDSREQQAAYAPAPAPNPAQAAEAPEEALARTVLRPVLHATDGNDRGLGAGAGSSGGGGDAFGDDDGYGGAEEVLHGYSDSDYSDATHSRPRSRGRSRSRDRDGSVSPSAAEPRAANANGRSRSRRQPGASGTAGAAASASGTAKKSGAKSPSPLRKAARSRSPRFAPAAPVSPGPFRTQLSSPSRAAAGASTAWATLSNSTVSDRDILRHLKGAPDLKELDRLLEEKQIAEKRRAIAAEAAAAAAAAAAGAASSGDPNAAAPGPGDESDPGRGQSASPPAPALEYGASYAAHLAQTEAAYSRAERQRAAQLEVAQRHAAWLAQNQNMPFVSPRSQSLAASRAERHAEARRAHDDALAAGADEKEARAHLDSLSLRSKRAALARAREEEDKARGAALYRMGARSRQLVDDLRANQSSAAAGPASAALRMYAEGQRAAAERDAARSAGRERQGVWQTERERDEAENCTFKPQLSALAHLVRPRSPIWRRSKPERDRGRTAIEREMAARAQEEDKQLTFRPTINPVSEQLARAKSQLTQSRLKTALVALGSRPRSAGSSPGRAGAGAGSELESLAGMVASDRLYGEAEFRALKAAQRQAQNDEIVQPFHPTLSAHAQPLPGEPRARVAQTRRQLKTLAFLEKHRRQLAALGLEGGVPATPASPTHWGSIGGQSASPVDWAAEKRRLERLQKDQLKTIHAQFLARNQDFLAKKKESLERISSRFRNSEGAYAYDPQAHAYVFRPFFAPQLNTTSSSGRTGADGSKGGRAKQPQPQQAHAQLLGEGSSAERSSSSSSVPITGSGAGGPALVSRRSSSLLRTRESERVSLLFALLDCAGTGAVDSSCRALVDDIPGALDRRIVAAIFERMDRRGASRRASDSHAHNEEKQQRSASPSAASAEADSSFYFSGGGGGSLAPIRADWTLDAVQFADLFAREQKRLVQREGPQGTEGLIAGRASAQASRASSGASTPGFGGGGGGVGGLGSGSVARGYCDRRDSFGGGGNSRSGSRSRSAGHSRSTSVDRGHVDASPRPAWDSSRRSSASVHGADESDAHPSFTPRIRRKSELLAARNHEQLLATMMWEQHAISGVQHAHNGDDDAFVASRGADARAAAPVSHPSPALSAVSAASPALRPAAHKRVIRPRAHSLSSMSHINGI